MNWRRGLFRTWISLSAVWACVVLILVVNTWPLDPPIKQLKNYPNKHGEVAAGPWDMNWTEADQKQCADARTHNPKLGNVFDCYDAPDLQEVPLSTSEKLTQALGKMAGWWLLPCLILLGLGALGDWVLRGFRKNA